jgi:hypothetical protein
MSFSKSHQARTAAPTERRLPSKVEGDHLSKIRLDRLLINTPNDATLCLLGTVPTNSIDEAGRPIAGTSSHHSPAAASQAVTADHPRVVTAEPFMAPAVPLTPNTGGASKNIARSAQAMAQPKETPSNAAWYPGTPIDIAQVGASANNQADDLTYPSQTSLPRLVSSVPSPIL